MRSFLQVSLIMIFSSASTSSGHTLRPSCHSPLGGKFIKIEEAGLREVGSPVMADEDEGVQAVLLTLSWYKRRFIQIHWRKTDSMTGTMRLHRFS